MERNLLIAGLGCLNLVKVGLFLESWPCRVLNQKCPRGYLCVNWRVQVKRPLGLWSSLRGMQWQTNREVTVGSPCPGSPPSHTQHFLLGPGPKAQHPTCLGGFPNRASYRPFQKLSTRSWMCPLLSTGSPPSLSSDLSFPSSVHNLYSLIPGINSLLHHWADGSLTSPDWHTPTMIL